MCRFVHRTVAEKEAINIDYGTKWIWVKEKVLVFAFTATSPPWLLIKEDGRWLVINLLLWRMSQVLLLETNLGLLLTRTKSSKRNLHQH